jgi:hypothetical protein
MGSNYDATWALAMAISNNESQIARLESTYAYLASDSNNCVHPETESQIVARHTHLVSYSNYVTNAIILHATRKALLQAQQLQATTDAARKIKAWST